MKKSKWKAYIELTCAVVAWGGSFIATKVALKEVAPVTVVWLRFAIGFVILGIAVIAQKQFVLPGTRDLAYFAGVGFIGITFHQWLQSTGLVTSQATTTAWIVATTPIFMALLGWLFLHEKLGGIQVLGIFLAVIGVLLVVTKGDLSSLSKGYNGAPGDFLILLSAPNWAIFSALSRWGLSKHPATRMMFFVMGFGWLFTSILFFASQGLSDISNLTIRGWIAIGFLGIFCSGLAYIFWYDGLQNLPIAQAGAFVYFEPLITVVIAAIVLNEPLILSSISGGLMILVGVWLVQRITYQSTSELSRET